MATPKGVQVFLAEQEVKDLDLIKARIGAKTRPEAIRALINAFKRDDKPQPTHEVVSPPGPEAAP